MALRIMTLAAILAVAGRAAEPQHTLKVCMTIPLSHPAWAYTGKARAVAGEILRDADVAVLWKSAGRNCVHDRASIMVQMKDGTPPNASTSAVARTYPYGSAVVEVYMNRLADGRGERLGPLLGHVIAHEIGHKLEGVARHSAQGVMKASWSDEEQREMNIRPLRFAAEDIDLIRNGIEERERSLNDQD